LGRKPGGKQRDAPTVALLMKVRRFIFLQKTLLSYSLDVRLSIVAHLPSASHTSVGCWKLSNRQGQFIPQQSQRRPGTERKEERDELCACRCAALADLSNELTLYIYLQRPMKDLTR
jgi:hypothetical protein